MKRILGVAGIAMLVAGGAQAATGFTETFSDRLEFAGVAVAEQDYFVWGSSPVVGPNGKVHLFVARWPAAKGGAGWMSDCEIARYVANDPEGPFVFQEVVVDDEPGQFSPHNPTVRKFGERYALLYICHDGRERHPRNQKIYMRVADSPQGPWHKAGDDGLILDLPADEAVWCYDSGVGVNNPSIIQHPDGRFLLYYKASPHAGGPRRFGVAVANELEGPYKHHPQAVTDNDKMIEDCYAFMHEGKFYILSRNDKQSLMPGYDGVLWESGDGFAFKRNPGYRRAWDYLPEDVKKNARAIWRRGEMERPQLLLIDGEPAYLYLAAGLSLTKYNNSINIVYRIKPELGK